MKDDELAAMKQTLAEEFGIAGIDDPRELRRVGEARVSGMNALDRAAFYARLGRNLEIAAARKRDSRAGVEPASAGRSTLLGYVFLAVAAWFVWRPLAVVVAMFGCSNIRHFAIRNAPFWKPSSAIVVGAVYGAAVAGLAKLGVTVTDGAALAYAVFGVLGFFAASYIGYAPGAQGGFPMPGDRNRTVAQVGALAGYCVGVASLFLGPMLFHGL